MEVVSDRPLFTQKGLLDLLVLMRTVGEGYAPPSNLPLMTSVTPSLCWLGDFAYPLWTQGASPAYWHVA